MDEELIITSLRRSALFGPADPEALRDFARQLRRRRFRRHEIIFHQGDPGDALHVVSSGAVKIVMPSADGDEAIIATTATEGRGPVRSRSPRSSRTGAYPRATVGRHVRPAVQRADAPAVGGSLSGRGEVCR